MKVPLAFLRVSQKKKTLFALQQPHTTLPASWERGGQHVADPRWGAEDRVTIRPLCREWTSAPFITSFQLKPSKKWLNNQLQANGAIYPCYGRTLVIDLGMSGQRQMSHSNGKGVRRMTERRVIRNKEKEMLISLMGEGCWGCKHESQGKKEKQSSRHVSLVTSWNTRILMSLTCAVAVGAADWGKMMRAKAEHASVV